MIIATFGAGQVAYSVLWLFFFFIEIWLEISIFIDIFRSHDMRGWEKAFWLFLVIIFPLIGIILYLIFRGNKMRVHQAQAAVGQETGWQWYPHGHATKTDQLARLADLHDRGVVSDAEFERLKAEILGQGPLGQSAPKGSRRRPWDTWADAHIISSGFRVGAAVPVLGGR